MVSHNPAQLSGVKVNDTGIVASPRAIRLWIILFLAVSITTAVIMYVNFLFAGVYWKNLTLHIALLNFGAITALLLAGLITINQKYDVEKSESVWITSAFIWLGFIAIFNSFIPPGQTSVWLQCLSIMGGGIIFSGVCLPDHIANKPSVRKLPFFVMPSVIIITILSLLLEPKLPLMIDAKGFTFMVKLMSYTGAAGFALAGVIFSHMYISSKQFQHLLFSAFCLLFAVAGISFEMSVPWSVTWWIWHLLRLIAYAVILLYLARLWNMLHQALMEERSSLEFRVKTRTHALNSEIEQRKLLEQRLEERIRQQEFAAYLGQRALVVSDMTEILDVSVTGIAELLDVEFAKVLELVPEGDELLLRSGVGWKEGLVGHARVSAGKNSQAGYTLLMNAPVIVQDLDKETRFSGPPLLKDHGVVSGISVVIHGSEKPYGVLGAHSRRHRGFSQQDTNFLQAIANILSEFIDKLKIENKLAESARSLQELNEELEKRIEQRTAQLQIANKELEAFSYSVSHDLRAPLRHVGGFIDLLANSTQNALDEQDKRYLRLIREAAARMGQLIDDLLSFSRTGSEEMKFSRVDLKQLVVKIVDDLKPELASRQVEWKIDDLPVVQGDHNLLRIVLWNLITNAMKFTSKCEKARISIISLSDKPGEIVIVVRDNGAGFDMKYVDKLFGVFQRLHRREDFEGTGIGLATVRRIINRHGGRTWAESTLGEGASFYFSLPGTSAP